MMEFFSLKFQTANMNQCYKVQFKKNPHLFHFTTKSLSKLVEKLDYKILSCDVFRPATKSEGMRQKIT